MSQTWNKIKELWRKHPYLFAGGIFIVGVLIIYLLFRKSPSPVASTGASDLSAYYAAAAAATQSGNDLQAQQVAAAAAVQASNNQLTEQLAAIGAAGQSADVAAQEQTKQTQILADAATNQANIAGQTQLGTAAVAAQSTDYTSLLGALVAGQNLSATNLQNAIQGITSISNTYNAANPGNTLTPPGADTIGNLVVNQNLDIGTRGINEIYGNPSGVPQQLPQIVIPKINVA